LRDVLENLQKLPPRCAAVIGGRAVFIRRGAGSVPADVLSPTTVDQWNSLNGVTPQQVQAMIVGATLGWDRDGADPETHNEVLDVEAPVGPFEYEYATEITVVIRPVGYHTEEQAAAAAKSALETLCDCLNENSPVAVVTDFGPGDTLDLTYTNDPR
jgi:hypothetical protein